MRKEYAFIRCFLVITLSKQTTSSALSQRGPEYKVMGKHCLNTKGASEVLRRTYNEIPIWTQIS